MATSKRHKIIYKINNLFIIFVRHAIQFLHIEFPQAPILRLHCAETLSKLGHRCAIFGLLKISTFTLFMSASPLVTAYGLSIPGDPINDSVIVKLQTTSVSHFGDTEITHWWVEAGSTGSGSGQSDYFSSGMIEAPVMTSLAGLFGPTNYVMAGISNALVTNLPMDGTQVFLSIWLKREEQPWKREMVSVVTASSSITPTATVEHNEYSTRYYSFGEYVWDDTSNASWYQIWITAIDPEPGGYEYYTKWYSHNEVCQTAQAVFPTQCAVYAQSPPWLGNFWVRAWNVHGGYGPWSTPFGVGPHLKEN